MAEEARRLIPSLYAIPVAGPSLELRRFVVERFIELGESGGVEVWWRPIASTTLADPIYKKLRSPELVRRDHNDARKYLHYCQRAGGEDNYVRGESIKLARKYGIRDDQRPAVVLLPRSTGGKFAALPLAPAAFETLERQRALGCFLYKELAETRMQQFMEGGVFSAGGLARLQSHADHIAAFVAKSIARDRGVPRLLWESYLAQTGLARRRDPGLHTVARAWRRHGSVYLSTVTDGKPDGTVEFSPQDGRMTKQMTLMLHLLLKWPQGMTFRQVAELLYAKETAAASLASDRDELVAVAKRIRSLVHDIRVARLDHAGMNPDILPATLRAKGCDQFLRLRLLDLDRRRLGQLSRPLI